MPAASLEMYMPPPVAPVSTVDPAVVQAGVAYAQGVQQSLIAMSTQAQAQLDHARGAAASSVSAAIWLAHQYQQWRVRVQSQMPDRFRRYVDART